MKLRLADFLRLSSVPFPPDMPVIIADPIWRDIDHTEDRDWKNTDFPNLAPIFPYFFIEAESSTTPGIYAGIIIKDLTEDVRANKAATTMNGEPTPDDTTWILGIQAIWTVPNRYKKFAQFPGLGFIHVGPDGRWLDDSQNITMFIDEEFADHIDDPKLCIHRGALPMEMMQDTIPFAFKALSLMHCKNVSIEKQAIPRQQRRQFERKYSVPMSDYHILKIKPVGRAKDANTFTGTQVTGLNRQHIVRGHFKLFGPDNPLFGKWQGLYWWESMVRGNPARGQIKKDYEVETEGEKSS